MTRGTKKLLIVLGGVLRNYKKTGGKLLVSLSGKTVPIGNFRLGLKADLRL